MTIEPGSWSKKLGLTLALTVGSTVLAALGHITSDQWLEFNRWIGGIYLGAQGVTDVAKAIKGTK